MPNAPAEPSTILWKDMTYALIARSEDIDSQTWHAWLPAQTACVLRWPEDKALLEQFEHWVVWLPDGELRILLNDKPQATLHLVPHEESRHAIRGFCLEPKPKVLPNDFLDRPTVKLDLLRVNDQVVLNKLVAGRAFSFQPGGHSQTFLQRLKTVGHQLKNIAQYRPQRFQLQLPDEVNINTAAIGVSCTSHVLNSGLSRNVLKENHANDGFFYALVVAPKSVFEMLTYFVVDILSSAARPPGFLGILRVPTLSITTGQPIPCHFDEQNQEWAELSLQVDEGAMTLAVPDGSPWLSTGARHKQVRKVQHLPTAEESVKTLAAGQLPWITHAATEDFRELYQMLRENAQPSGTFIMFMALSALLATFGLYANSAPVIIGAMILAPLMAPIVSLAMALTRQDGGLLESSLKTVLMGIGVAVGFSGFLAALMPLALETAEITARVRPTLLDLGVAMVSGIAGAYAHARVQVAKSLAGVAIAVALVPPLAVVGVGLGWADARIAFGALLLFLTNLAGILFAASCTFLTLGFAPFARARRGLVLALVAVLAISVPLGISFAQMAREAEIVRAVKPLKHKGFELRDIQVVSHREPVRIQLQVVAQNIPERADIEAFRREIEAELGETVKLDIAWVLRY